MFRSFIQCMLLITCLTGATVWAADPLKLTNGEWPPYLSKEYKHHGLISHIVTEAFKQSGVTVEYGFFPWKRAFKEAQEGKKWAGSVVWTKNPDREADFVFSDTVIELKEVFFHRKDLQFDWSTMKDLSKYKIGASIGYSYGDAFAKAEADKLINVARTAKDETSLKKLAAGRIDLFPATLEVGYALIADKLDEASGKLLTNHPKPLRETSYHLILSKKVANSEELIKKFNEGLAKIKSSGVYDKMLTDSIDGKYRP
ncbi:substrate-binding periplasmic protein [Spartinivicinus poritis]|uniref:Transporter substrate-binding domain-containing protein n=1 Tax=Spartinivicinus poritis TaxID=2994640 RepID=A0ABT5U8F1_9GAMM|nr:transporter substrate-binding domain-containing protein [Spartinivicinus sp. A2-2]MDE1462587.1 transporter substrate-binding domain-containing protein [Spartinivicinus sp. A2-2]